MEHYIEQLIKKFWAGTASLEERQILLLHLKEHDGKLREELESSFLKEVDPAVLQLNNESLQVELLNKIHERAGIGMPRKPLTGKYGTIAKLAVAASLIAVVCLITWLKLQKEEPAKSISGKVVHKADSIEYNNNDDIVAKPVAFKNTGEVASRFTLPDLSVVVLESHSRIYYKTGVGNKARMVTLTGAAKFNVFHDKKRPFTVLANGYATTALGTEFLVNAKNIKKTRIELFTGKVIVRAMAQSGVKDVYLKPGDELTISNDNGKSFIVNRLTEQKTIEVAKDRPGQLKTVIDNPVLQFNLTPLDQVFPRLSKLKNMVIVTDHADLKNKVFTGEFLPNESLETMLSIICDVNNFRYRIEDGRIIITGR